MGSYGPYETNREIGSSYGATVYSARKTGDSADSYAVKVYSIDSLVGDNPENRADLDPLLHDLDRTLTGRIELQKKAAESSRYIAPILESGQEGQEVWYTTRLYLVCWPNGEEQRQTLDGRIPYLELGSL